MNPSRLCCTAASLLCIGALSGAARAQEERALPPRPFAIKGGGFFPSGGTLQKGVGRTFPSGGLSLAVSQSEGSRPRTVELYADYFGRRSLRTLTGGIALRVPLTAMRRGAQVYGGGGIGLTYVDPDPQIIISASPFGSSENVFFDSANRVVLGGKLFLGVQFRGGFLVEAEYLLLPSVQSVPLSGFGARVGVRF